MEQQIYTLFSTHTQYNKSTCTLYAKKLSQWVSYISPPTTHPQSIDILFGRPENILHSLKTRPDIKQTPANIHIYVSALIAYLDYIQPRSDTQQTQLKSWKAIQKENWAPRAEHYNMNQPTSMQSDKVISMESISATRDSLEYASPARILLSMYSLIEPVRADYYATEIISAANIQPIEDNYIILYSETPKIIIREFKTQKRYTTLEIPIPQQLVNEIRDSLIKTPRRYLFVSEDNPIYPMTRKTFSNWACRTLARVFGRPMTLTALRHAYISSLDFNRPVKELDTISKRMGHSLEMQRRYEWKVSSPPPTPPPSEGHFTADPQP